MTGFALVGSGKVREIYQVGHDRLLIVASDRISAFDVVLEDEIPRKGHVLTGLSAFWFERIADIAPHHLVSADPTDLPEAAGPDVAGRAMLVRRARPVRMECVVRGYLTGSAWQEYRQTGQVGGLALPGGLRESERLPEPIFTPTTKAESGHDLPLSPDEGADLVGPARYEELRGLSLQIYERGAALAADRGIIIADSKLEFGEIDGSLAVIDEVFTPDSSRFWPSDHYEAGRAQPSFDKQYVRDHLDSTGWDHTPPAPRLPAEVVAGTSARYVEAYERLTGQSFETWFGTGNV